MIEFEAATEIAAPPLAVWRLLVDLSREPLWMRATRSVVFTSGEAYVPGARMERAGRFMGLALRWQSEIAEVESERLISFHHSGAVTGTSRWEITPAPGGCRVRFWSRGPAPGPLRWFPALATAGGRAGLRADLRRLKDLVECAERRTIESA